jgi:uncharacterized protein
VQKNNLFLPKPVVQDDRLQTIDVLRGVALLGILLINISSFALPEHFTDTIHSNFRDPNFWTDAVITTMFEGKMRALFSMIFGAGILLFVRNKEHAGHPFKFLFFRRMGWLVLFGLIHAHILLWAGDILYFYGLIGILAFFFRKLKAKYLLIGVLLMAVVDDVSYAVFYKNIDNKHAKYNSAKNIQKQHKPLSAKQITDIKEWEETGSKIEPNESQVTQYTKMMKSNYSTVAWRIGSISWYYEIVALYVLVGDVLGLMLLGMALYKWKFFTGGWSKKQYIFTALVGCGIGLPLVIYSYCYSHQIPMPGGLSFLNYLKKWSKYIYPFQRILLVMAYGSVLMLILKAGIWKGFTTRLAAVGQMAFTNYIIQTVFCTLFFFGYGLNYFAEMQYYQLYFVVAVIWFIQLIISPIWLKYFLFGPLEWLWRSLTYWQLQPMQRD